MASAAQAKLLTCHRPARNQGPSAASNWNVSNWPAIAEVTSKWSGFYILTMSCRCNFQRMSSASSKISRLTCSSQARAQHGKTKTLRWKARKKSSNGWDKFSQANKQPLKQMQFMKVRIAGLVGPKNRIGAQRNGMKSGTTNHSGLWKALLPLTQWQFIVLQWSNARWVGCNNSCQTSKTLNEVFWSTESQIFTFWLRKRPRIICVWNGFPQLKPWVKMSEVSLGLNTWTCSIHASKH